VPKEWSTLGVDLLLEIDPATARRSGLEHALRDSIRSGRLAARTRLPSSRTLATELGLARGTVAAAYDQLVAEGYLIARPGSGTSVAALLGAGRDRVSPAEPALVPRLDLRPGSPDVTTFPTAAWLRATRRALNAAPAEVYGYGDPRGRIELRTALADYLARTRGVLVSPDRLVITSGYVQALALLSNALLQTGRTVVAMEDPGLDFHRDVVRRSGQQVIALAVDDRGACADLLSSSSHAGTGAVVVTPAHQYPTGVTLHPERRRTLIEWAERQRGVIVEDDYDSEFRYGRQPIGAVHGMASERVVYIGSASKTLGPAVRLAWMALPPALVEPVVETKRHADVHTESLGQLTLADLIATHAYDRHIRSVRLGYRRRRDVLVELVQAQVPGVSIRGVAAGLQTLVDLPPHGPDEDTIIDRAAAGGLALSGVRGLWHGSGEHAAGIVVGFATPPRHLYRPAIDALVSVLSRRTD
jgi:GntR family transcriptional regulator / MocR family aminotransferase